MLNKTKISFSSRLCQVMNLAKSLELRTLCWMKMAAVGWQSVWCIQEIRLASELQRQPHITAGTLTIPSLTALNMYIVHT